ncbi:MAG: energy transducer TonB [Deltaproteobacteria bacterium]|nr:energy transducer TonB [Deltaproteobacteria bacterium]
MNSNGLKTPFAVSLVLHGAAVFAVAVFLTGGARRMLEITPIEIIETAKEPPSRATAGKSEVVPEKAGKKATVKKEEPLRASLPVKPDLPKPPEKEAAQTRARSPEAPHEEEAHEAAETTAGSHALPPVSAQAETEVRNDTGDKTPGRSAEDETGRFMAMARSKIEKVKSYPRWARERGFEGMVGVRFVITPDGTVDEITIVRPCHCEALNRAACESIKKAAPFGPRPSSLEGKKLAMEVDIGFRLE